MHVYQKFLCNIITHLCIDIIEARSDSGITWWSIWTIEEFKYGMEAWGLRNRKSEVIHDQPLRNKIKQGRTSFQFCWISTAFLTKAIHESDLRFGGDPIRYRHTRAMCHLRHKLVVMPLANV